MYHLCQLETEHKWTIQKTADFFRVSIGLASENLKLAELFIEYPELMKYETRRDALGHIEKIRFNKYRVKNGNI